MVKKHLIIVLLFTLSIFMIGCETTSIARYDETAYSQIVSLKVDSLSLIEKGTEAYSLHEAEVVQLQKELQFAYEYAHGRPKNAITAEQIHLLMDPEGYLLGGFLKRWENEGSLRKAFVDNAKGLISDAFDQIIGLESGKIRPDDVR
jgi:hypothetical protein